MASTNKDLVDSATDVLRSGLAPFIGWKFNGCYGKQSGHSPREILGKSAHDVRAIVLIVLSKSCRLMYWCKFGR